MPLRLRANDGRQLRHVTVTRPATLPGGLRAPWGAPVRVRLSVLRIDARCVVCRSEDGYRLAIFGRTDGQGWRAAGGRPALGGTPAADMSAWTLVYQDLQRVYAPRVERAEDYGEPAENVETSERQDVEEEDT